MAKGKPESLPNRSIYTRVSYLHQAASYLATVQSTTTCGSQPNSSLPHDDAHSAGNKERPTNETVARRLTSEVRAVSLKAQIRSSPAVKQTMCKFCDTLLVEGKTCSTTVENASKGGRKPWADVMVIKCGTCGRVKRFPVNSPRQKRRAIRDPKAVEMQAPAAAGSEPPSGGD